MKQPKTKLAVSYRPVDSLEPYARNSRTHSDRQVEQIAASITEFGFTQPILVDGKSGIIAGHGRLMAAKSLGMTEVPVIELSGLSEAQKRAYVIADNKLTLNGGWDDAILADELRALGEEGFDLKLTGFDDVELVSFLTTGEGLTDPDDVPDAPAVPVSRLGDVWQCGNHRVMCGDSTDADTVAQLMGGDSADMVFTDPPYGMSYGGGRGKKSFGMIKGDDAQGDDLIKLVSGALSCALERCKPGAAAYICFPWRTYAEFEQALAGIGLEVASCIVWDKGSIGLGHQEYRPQHEFIFYCKGGAWYGDRAQSDVWALKRGSTGDYVHPTQKPVELVTRALSNSSKAGDVIVDSFGGSGSTLIACEQTGRAGRIVELDPIYADVIVTRWQAFTGRDAVLAGTATTFAETAAQRAQKAA